MSDWACFKCKRCCRDLCLCCPEVCSGAQHKWGRPVLSGQLKGGRNRMDAAHPLCYLCSPLPARGSPQPAVLCSFCWTRLSKLALAWSLVRQYAAQVIYKAWRFTRLSLCCISMLEVVKIVVLGLSSWADKVFFKIDPPFSFFFFF